jgi:hypothetical protein
MTVRPGAHGNGQACVSNGVDAGVAPDGPEGAADQSPGRDAPVPHDQGGHERSYRDDHGRLVGLPHPGVQHRLSAAPRPTLDGDAETAVGHGGQNGCHPAAAVSAFRIRREGPGGHGGGDGNTLSVPGTSTL